VLQNPGERESKRTRLKQRPTGQEDEYELSRFKPAVRTMLEEHVANRLDGQLFPYLPSNDGNDANGTGKPAAVVPPSFRAAPTPPPGPTPSAGGSLRSQRPNWHRAGTTGGSAVSSSGGASLRDGGRGPAATNGRDANRQRLIIFVAGGVTYSEMRSAYQVGQALGKEVIIGASCASFSVRSQAGAHF
jgi:syntaxin-binding protein 1